MNYLHIYHAGNFADIVKHIVLISVLLQLQKKQKPFAVLDCFAGSAIYDLASEQATKTLESDHGIKKLLSVTHNSNEPIPELIECFLRIMKHDPGLYYGSPMIITQLLREQDILIASELHMDEFFNLKQILSSYHNAKTHNMDAYNSIKAFLPFQENRGLIFIDPPFEKTDEFEKLIVSLKIIKQRASNICTILWYPIKNHQQIQTFYKEYQSIGFKESLIIECEMSKKHSSNMIGADNSLKKCGLIVSNPPMIRNQLLDNFSYLKRNLGYSYYVRCV